MCLLQRFSPTLWLVFSFLLTLSFTEVLTSVKYSLSIISSWIPSLVWYLKSHFYTQGHPDFLFYLLGVLQFCIFFRSVIHFFCFYLFIYLWLCWVFISVRGLSLVVASGGHSSSRCAGLSLSRPLLLRSTGSRRAGSVIVAHGPSCSAAHGIFPDQGSNLCPLHWQADSQPLRHRGSR